MDSISSNQIIAKNATVLYLRMFISMAISFYTSRIVLQALGVSDYGIYNVVGGVTILINVLVSSLGGATSRFITYALGKNDIEYLRDTFSTAAIVHIGLALSFIFVGETLGLWFINTQLVIPEGRMIAANWVYQSSIISVATGITQIPYSASITSHERMSAFAYIDILNALCKLGIAAFVLFYSGDHLIIYSVLYAAMSISFQLFYRYYCIKHFEECHIARRFNKILFKEMLSFSSWSMLGSITLTFKNQGVNILINRFFGTLLNAASGVAMQVQGLLYAFTGNITMAFNPQIIKSYASSDYKRVNELIGIGTKFTALVTILTTIPFIFNMDFLMGLWLKEVPRGAVAICQILLFANFFNSFNTFIKTAMVASGKIKHLNVAMSSFYVCFLVGTYLIIKYTHSYLCAYVLGLASSPIATIICAVLLKRIMPFFAIRAFFIKTYGPMLGVFIASMTIAAFFSFFVGSALLSFLYTFFLCESFVLFATFYFVLDKQMRRAIVTYIKLRLRLR